MIRKFLEIIIITLFLVCISAYAAWPASEKSIVVIVPSYNNAKYCEGNLDSILNQKYKNYRVIYIDDRSSDGMSEMLDEYLQKKGIDFTTTHFAENPGSDIADATLQFEREAKRENRFFTLIHNVNRVGALANIYRAITSTDDSDIIVLVDGDDKLHDINVLKRVNKSYSSKKEIWLTHGNLIEYPTGECKWCKPVPADIVKRNAFREFRCPSHLRTFYAWLFKKIDINDLLYQGNFFSMAWDMAIMYPMIEMSGDKHAFLSRVNYIYNIENNINDNKVNANLQNELDRVIRNMPPYKPLNQ